MDAAGEAALRLDFKKNHRSTKLIGVALLVVLAIGTGFYHYVEGLRWIDAIYFCTINLTTIGHGDMVPSTDVSKIFTIFYVMTGIAVFFGFASLLIKNIVLRNEIRLLGRHKAP